MMTFDPKVFRKVLGHFPTGVTIVTGVHQGEPLGMTVNSFNSVSLDPPLISFCAAQNSTSWPRLAECKSLGVNVLGSHQQALATKFAKSGQDKFSDVKFEVSPLGSPVLDGAVAIFDCEHFDRIVAGDHIVVLLKVIDLSLHAEANSPLVFFSGGFRSLSN